jgi:hypothetical protein
LTTSPHHAKLQQRALARRAAAVREAQTRGGTSFDLIGKHMQMASDNFYAQKVIPRTTPQTYITGHDALNIHGDDDSHGEWHDVFWHPIGVRRPPPVSLGGQGCFDTNPVYGTWGVREARASVVGMGLFVAPDITEVYVANHTRAILDLLFCEIKSYGHPTSTIQSSWDWLDTAEQRDTLLMQAHKLAALLQTTPDVRQLEEWISRERTLLDRGGPGEPDGPASFMRFSL